MFTRPYFFTCHNMEVYPGASGGTGPFSRVVVRAAMQNAQNAGDTARR